MQPAAKQGAIPIVPSGARPRLESIDVVRGAIMVLMALDHVRDFFHHDALLFEPTDLSQTNAALFLTRWITHFCAPVFFFLAGTSAFLSFGRGKSKNDLARFLVSRGLWLVFLELTVVRCLGWGFNFNYHVSGLLVIWALGWSMIVLAALIYLPRWLITVFAVVMIAGHNLLDAVDPKTFGGLAWLWKIFHVPGELHPVPGMTLGIAYPLVPWVGVMAAGYVFGACFKLERRERQKGLFWLGIALTATFLIIRAANTYGDPTPWNTQRSAVFTLLSFINCEKYPPSVLYLLMTLGPVIILLALLDRDLSPIVRPFIVFGRVPLFFYLLHLPLMHGIAVGLSYLKYGRADWLFGGPAGIPVFGAAYPRDYGYSLLVVYLIWIAVVVLLYPLCRWFARVKQERRDVWLSYL
ncbi:MAG: heparan-alpha-glucosaminide N-acetyltransferase domain-containing protein [Verrucomicrobiota bacterium]